MGYLWDTNIVIYFLQNQFPANAEKLIDALLTESSPIISVITEMELLCWKSPQDKDTEVLKSFIDEIQIIELTEQIKYKAVELRKNYIIKLPDAIIAATAIVNDLHLITRNTKDFKNIKRLKLINPFEVI